MFTCLTACRTSLLSSFWCLQPGILRATPNPSLHRCSVALSFCRFIHRNILQGNFSPSHFRPLWGVICPSIWDIGFRLTATPHFLTFSSNFLTIPHLFLTNPPNPSPFPHKSSQSLTYSSQILRIPHLNPSPVPHFSLKFPHFFLNFLTFPSDSLKFPQISSVFPTGK